MEIFSLPRPGSLARERGCFQGFLSHSVCRGWCGVARGGGTEVKALPCNYVSVSGSNRAALYRYNVEPRLVSLRLLPLVCTPDNSTIFLCERRTLMLIKNRKDC